MIITTLHCRTVQRPMLIPMGQIVLNLAPTGDSKDVKALSLWFHGIGNPDFRGTYTGADPYTLNGDGSGFYNTKYDIFYFLHSEKAELLPGWSKRGWTSIENTNSSAMAGVMIRDSLDPSCVFAAAVVTPDNRLIFMARTNTSPTASAIGTVSGITIPHWVRIYRTGTPAVFTAKHANDVNGSPDIWKEFAVTAYPKNWPVASPINLGLCVSSNSYGNLCTAKFSNVTMQAPYGTGIADPTTRRTLAAMFSMTLSRCMWFCRITTVTGLCTIITKIPL